MKSLRLAGCCILAATLAISPTLTFAEEAAMPVIDTVAYVQSFEAVFNGHDPAAAAALITADFVDHAPWPGQTPDLAGFQAGLAEMLVAFPDLKVEVERTVSEGDMLTAHFILSGTHLGPFMAVPASGKTFRAEAIDILRMREGRIAEHWGVIDAAAIMQQLGL